MLRNFLVLFSVLAAVTAKLPAQTQAAGTIQALGSASVSAQPDQAQLTVSVSTDGATAQQAARQNATQTNQVLTALKQVLGTRPS